jgi:hypothetical protein
MTSLRLKLLSNASRHPRYRYEIFVMLTITKHLLLSIYLSLCSPLLDLGRFFSCLILYTVDRTPRTGDQPVARPLPTHTTQTQSKRIQTSMPRVGFEPMIPALERAKTIHPLDRAANVIGLHLRLVPTKSYDLSYISSGLSPFKL